MAFNNIICPYCNQGLLSFTNDGSGREVGAFCDACSSVFLIEYRPHRSGWQVVAHRKNPEHQDRLDSPDLFENLEKDEELEEEGISPIDGVYIIATIGEEE